MQTIKLVNLLQVFDQAYEKEPKLSLVIDTRTNKVTVTVHDDDERYCSFYSHRVETNEIEIAHRFLMAIIKGDI